MIGRACFGYYSKVGIRCLTMLSTKVSSALGKACALVSGLDRLGAVLASSLVLGFEYACCWILAIVDSNSGMGLCRPVFESNSNDVVLWCFFWPMDWDRCIFGGVCLRHDVIHETLDQAHAESPSRIMAIASAQSPFDVFVRTSQWSDLRS